MATSMTTYPSEIVVPQGPYGGLGGSHAFYDGVGDILQITVTYSNDVVHSVQTVYYQGTAKFTTDQHGHSGPSTFRITLDIPTEYLVQVTGTSAPAAGKNHDVVTSLSFVTNRTTYGPFGAGEGQGREFQSSPHGKVMGFFGKTSKVLESIGIFTDFSDPYNNLSAEGPWGGAGGDVFYDGRADKIVAIDVEHEDAIISLDVKYAQGNQHFLSAKHGGSGTVKGVVDKIVFESDEYLVQVTGTQGIAYGKLTLVKSLTLITNKRSYGPYGDKYSTGTSFQTHPNAQVLGFFGRCGWMVDQLGAFVALPPRPVIAGEAWGGDGGSAFYEGRGEIDQITVVYTDEYISRLQVTYLQGGKSFETRPHGTAQGQTVVIKLNAGEYVVQVLGTHGPGADAVDLILSLKFITNKTTYGPYGKLNHSGGTSFASSTEGRVVGFFGRSGNHLDQLGTIVAPIILKA